MWGGAVMARRQSLLATELYACQHWAILSANISHTGQSSCPDAQRGAAQAAKRKHMLTAIPQPSGTDRAATVIVTRSMEDQGSKLSSLQITYGHTKQKGQHSPSFSGCLSET